MPQHFVVSFDILKEFQPVHCLGVEAGLFQTESKLQRVHYLSPAASSPSHYSYLGPL